MVKRQNTTYFVNRLFVQFGAIQVSANVDYLWSTEITYDSRHSLWAMFTMMILYDEDVVFDEDVLCAKKQLLWQ